jgi:hypothetical protein
MIAFSWLLLLIEILLTGSAWGMVAIWVSSGFCGIGEYDIFFGLWIASIAVGISSIAIAWGSQAKILAAVMLLVLFFAIMSWVDYGYIVVAACPIYSG